MSDSPLPPSPEIKSLRQQPQQLSDFSLELNPSIPSATTIANQFSQSRRLRSVARYQNFHPQVLACSDTLTSSLDSLNEDDQPNALSSTSLSSTPLMKNRTSKSNSADATSLGAVAGPHGVALFKMSSPHIPLLILSHATNSTSKKSNISGLAFQPNAGCSNSSSLYLAASRGFSVLVWEASGHSAMPLRGRLGADSSTDVLDTSRITSICWKPSSRHATGTSPLLATTTSDSISLWDLRVAQQGSTATVSAFKPTLRFGASRKKTSFSNSVASAPTIVQVACSSDSDECATIDTSGIVRIYDIRMTERTRATKNLGSAVSSFCAHEATGVGISYFQTTTNNNSQSDSSSSWLTWGLDSPKASAVAKFWSRSSEHQTVAQQGSMDPEDYWYMCSTPSWNRSDYQLKGQLVRPNLACARVCASPIKNSFLSVGHLPYSTKNAESQGGWWAELCTLACDDSVEKTREEPDEQLSPTTFGLNSVVKFQGGGTANSSWDQKALLSALGGREDLGRLQAAELAFSGGLNRNRLTPPIAEGSSDIDTTFYEEKGNIELLLCCLSDNSVITTHVVPESVPEVKTSKFSSLSRREQSPRRGGMVRTTFPMSHQPKVYPEDKEGLSLSDAAGFWNNNTNIMGGETPQNHAGDLRTFAEHKSSPQRKTLQHVDVVQQKMAESSNPPKREGGIIPFDIEVPVAYGSVSTNTQVAMTDMSSGNVVSSSGLGVVEEGEPDSGEVRESIPILENIESERVPCPRLCGATFGGNFGLVVFHNGEINKMWNWYQRADTIRLSSISGGKIDNTSSDPESLRLVHDTSDTHPLSTGEKEKRSVANGPRTLKELVNMMAAAKEAQWGERDGSDDSGSDDESSAGDNFFEDESLDSNSSESADETGDGLTQPSSNNQVYNRYFGAKAWKGTANKIESGTHHRQNSESSTSRKMIPAYAGPSYEMLTPIVTVTYDYDPIMLNRQSIALAEGWELGTWENPIYTDIQTENQSFTEQISYPANLDYVVSPHAGQGLPPYRHLVQPTSPAAARKGTLSRIKSDPNIGLHMMTKRSRALDDLGVHGGEYSVRPNMQESVTFLKKLFSHQQEGGNGAYPNMLSPPDNPLGWQRPSSTGNIHFEGKNFTNEINQANDSVSNNRIIEVGVYTILRSQQDANDKDAEVHENIKGICLHNAEVCKSVGETEKEGVWNLLAQTVESQINSEQVGWGENGGGALGEDLISNLLKYYEGLGDSQMLATIFCVLSGGCRNTSQPGSLKLLPHGQDEKYDSYIRKYAELLYAWGLLSLRAELNKHLIRIPSRLEGGISSEIGNKLLLRTPPRREGALSVEERSDSGRVPGVAVIFHCPRCGQDTDSNTNFCRSCQDFAFRCSICDNAVRGLFTVCAVCGHGGHLQHMKLWFSSNSQCPTGCGCDCKFVPSLSISDEVIVGA